MSNDRSAGTAVAVTTPFILACSPVVGMLVASAPVLPPPIESLLRIVLVLGAGVTVVVLLGSVYWPIAIVSNVLAVFLLLIGLYPAMNALLLHLVGRSGGVVAGFYLLGCASVAWTARRLGGEAGRTLQLVLRIVAAVFAVFAAITVARTYGPLKQRSPSVEVAIDRLLKPWRMAERTVSRPDVYHLVLDGMGRPDILESRYEMAVTETITALRDLGFHVHQARGLANYGQTHLSLASMLNAAYLDTLLEVQRNSRDRGPLRDVISRARVPAAFKRQGYQVEFIGSGYRSSGAFEAADVCNCPQLWFADAEFGALSLTPFKFFLGSLGNRSHYSRALAVFEAFERPRTGAAPRYIFAHVAAPHPPFVMDRYGAFVNPGRPSSGADASFFLGSADEYRRGYKAQAAFVLDRSLRAVRRVLDDAASARREVILIVHGDHGPRLGLDALRPTAEAGRMVLPVWLAIRWPAGLEPEADPDSLVNVYRTVFREVFGANLPPLPDIGFVSSFDSPYAVVPIGPGPPRPPHNPYH